MAVFLHPVVIVPLSFDYNNDFFFFVNINNLNI